MMIAEMSPDVIAVKPNEDFTLDVSFQNGEVKRFDVKPYLVYGVYNRLRDWDYFQHAAPCLGTVSWPHEEDFCPDTIYLKSTPIE